MERFATGFSVAGATRPGYRMENDEFSVTFKGVVCDEAKNVITEGFEVCYCWSPVMSLLLDACSLPWLSPTDIEESAEELLREWLQEFQGWGLLSALLPPTVSRYFILSLAYTAENWDTESGGDFSEEKVFEAVKTVYNAVPGKELHNILPSFGVWFEEIEREEGEEEEEGAPRRKVLSLFFRAKWVLEVKFILEKKRVNSSLVHLAAEATVQRLRLQAEIPGLGVPASLHPVLRDKLKHLDWERSYYSYRDHLAMLEREREQQADEPEQPSFLLPGIKSEGFEEEIDNIVEESPVISLPETKPLTNLQRQDSHLRGGLSWQMMASMPLAISVLGYFFSRYFTSTQTNS